MITGSSDRETDPVVFPGAFGAVSIFLAAFYYEEMYHFSTNVDRRYPLTGERSALQLAPVECVYS
jgi:hypothetical protein